MKFTLDEFDTSLLTPEQIENVKKCEEFKRKYKETHELHYLNELMMIVPHWAIKEEVRRVSQIMYS